MTVLSQLNPAQREAVQYVSGPMLVVAGAGSGKTRVITYKIAHLIADHGFPPHNILAVTFTNKAAEEMKNRVKSRLSDSITSSPMICTFHSFCARFLRQEIEILGYPRSYTIYDGDDQKRLVKNILKSLNITDRTISPEYIRSLISRAKINELAPGEYSINPAHPAAEYISTIYRQYEEQLKRSGALDFDDLLLKTNKILSSFPEIRARWNNKYKYLLVDEFQDTNPPQYRLVKLLAGQHKNICVVGDEDQAIYGFRGAILANILHFESDFKGSKVFKLEQNYRSTRMILRAASSVAAHNQLRREKELWTENYEGDPIDLYRANDPTDEAGWIARSVRELLFSSSEIIVGLLYRTNFQSRQLEDALRSAGIRYRLVGGVSFYSRKEIKDLLAYLKILQNPNDDVSLLRIINLPARGIGDKTLQYLLKKARHLQQSLWDTLILERSDNNTLSPRAQSALNKFLDLVQRLRDRIETLSLSDLVSRVYKDSGYSAFLQQQHEPDWETRVDNIQEFINFSLELQRDGGTLTTLMDHVALFSDDENSTSNARVTLMTLHGSKGLEFDHVFIAGFEEGLIPHSRAIQAEDEIEEERRLCYVGMTRARKRLSISHVASRRRLSDGSFERTSPSRFLAEIPVDCLRPLSILNRYAPSSTNESTAPSATKLKEKGFRSLDTLDEVKAFFSGKTVSSEKIGPSAPAIVTRVQKQAPASISSDSPAKRLPGIHPPSATIRFYAGDRVVHASFGRGTVLKVENSQLGRKLKISFDTRGTKNLLEHLARLEKAPQ